MPDREVGDDVDARDGYLRPVLFNAGVCNGGHGAPPNWKRGQAMDAGEKVRDFFRDSERPFRDFGGFLCPFSSLGRL